MRLRCLPLSPHSPTRLLVPTMTAVSTYTAAPTTKRRALVVFDYDYSLVNADCDVFVLQQLCPELLDELMASVKTPPPSWPVFIDDALRQFHEREPELSRDDIMQAVAEIPVLPKMLDTVKKAVDEHDATVVIISDANTVFIDSMLTYRQLASYITEVRTNPAHWEGESSRLRLEAYHLPSAEPHGCGHCPSNMCKGRILDEMRAKYPSEMVLYVGDGIGDYCPSTRLCSDDVVFARANDASGKAFGLLDKIRANPQSVAARVVPWTSGDAIYEHFDQLLGK